MNQQPDKFFRDKLEDFQKNPPASAWDKIAAAQNKKKSKGLWWRVAATFLLLASATYLLLPSTRTPDASLAETNNTGNNLPDTARKQPAVEDTTEKVEAANPIAHYKRSADKKTPRGNNHTAEVVTPAADSTEKNNSAIAVPEIETRQPIEVTVAKEDTNKTRNPVANIKHVTLTYSAEDVSEYLNKNDLADATSEDKKPSTLKKLLKKANDLNTNQDPLGELRQKKNEILALNFRNDKQRGQNT